MAPSNLQFLYILQNISLLLKLCLPIWKLESTSIPIILIVFLILLIFSILPLCSVTIGQNLLIFTKFSFFQIPPSLQERDAEPYLPDDGGQLQVWLALVRRRFRPWCCPCRRRPKAGQKRLYSIGILFLSNQDMTEIGCQK